MPTPEVRRTGRVILLDERGRVLLFRFQSTKDGRPFAFWATPGGRAEGDETGADAARRELLEETGLSLAVEGPVHSHVSTFELDGRHFEGRDEFFTARCRAEDPTFTGGTELDEQKALQEMRWWDAADLEASGETVFPPGLASVIRRVAG